MNMPDEKTKGELDIINEFTRTLLVQWCNIQLHTDWTVADSIADHIDNSTITYLRFAQNKGWISADGKKVLAAGFKTAAAFLRR